MRILFLIHSLARGGAERQMTGLAAGMSKRQHTTTVAVLRGGGALECTLKEACVPIARLDENSEGHLHRARALIRLVQSAQPQVLCSYLTVPNLFAAVTRAFYPKVKIVWSLRFADLDLRPYDGATRATCAVEPFLGRFADLIVVNSRAGQRSAIKRRYPAHKLAIIPNGVDTSIFRPDRDAGRRFRRTWRVSDDAFAIGLPARLDPVKGHLDFLQAAATIAAAEPRAHFLCIGGGHEELERDLRETAADLGLGDRVTWTGETADMNAAYNALDLVCLTSHSESFPNVLVEAMACGVPCISTDVGDAARILCDHGEIVSPGHPSDMAAACHRHLRRSEKADGQTLRNHVLHWFSQDALVSCYEETFRQII